MLVLSRKCKESVVVSGFNGMERELKIMVIEIHSGRVRLGFEVDGHVAVHRSEVWARIQEQGRTATITDLIRHIA